MAQPFTYCSTTEPAFHYFYETNCNQKSLIALFSDLYTGDLTQFMMAGWQVIEENPLFFQNLT